MLRGSALPDDSVGRIIRSRVPWLAGGLVGAALAGAVVGSFEDQLKQAAILASFIPVWLVQLYARDAGVPVTWLGPIWAVANYSVAIGSMLTTAADVEDLWARLDRLA